MEVYWIWWLAAVVLVIAEMNSGTFYLLAVAVRTGAAGLSAWLGMAWALAGRDRGVDLHPERGGYPSLEAEADPAARAGKSRL